MIYIRATFFIIILKFLVYGDYFNNNNFPEICINSIQNPAIIVGTNKACKVSREIFPCKKKLDIKNVTLMESKTSPRLVCRDYNSLTITWNTSVQLQFLEYTNSENNQSLFTEVLTSCNIKTLDHLSSNTVYNIRLWSYKILDKILFQSSKISVNTLKITSNRTPVRKLDYELHLSDDGYMATVKWLPGPDFSCVFELVWQKKYHSDVPMFRKVYLQKTGKSEYNITNLDFGNKYDLKIMSKNNNGMKESAKRTEIIRVPTCLQTYQNLSICSPERPKGLNITFNPFLNNTINRLYEIMISWTKPKYIPDYYNLVINLYITNNELISFSQNVSGNLNSTNFQMNGIVGVTHYDILLTAYSYAGSSQLSVTKIITRHINEEEIISFLWIWSFIGSLIIIISVTLIVIKCKIIAVVSKNLQIRTKLDNFLTKCSTKSKYDSKWEINESKLILDKIIGVGAFGIVQKGYYNFDGNNKKTTVAIKMLKAKASDEQISQFYDEIEIMKVVPPHSNIVRLIGIVTKLRTNNPLLLVEYCSNGDLLTLLKKAWLITDSPKVDYVNNCISESNGNPLLFQKLENVDKLTILENKYVLRWRDLLSFARQIAIAMEYLSRLHIIHRDLAARNILLSENNTIKVSDFGLSRNIESNHMYQKVTGGMLPFRWMALESLTYQIYTTESDVWSFGIVLWEIVTLGEIPYPSHGTEDLLLLLKAGYRMKKPINCKNELYEVMLRCWNASPNQRPTFTELREIFDKFLESEVFYISVENVKESDKNGYVNVKEISK